MVRLSEYICSGAASAAERTTGNNDLNNHHTMAFPENEVMRTPTASTAPSTTTECPPFRSNSLQIDEIRDTYHHVHRLTEVATIGCMRLRDFDTFTPHRFSQFDADMRAELQWILTRPKGTEDLHSGKLAARLKALCRKYCIAYEDWLEGAERTDDLINPDFSAEKRLRAALSNRKSWTVGGHQNAEASLALDTIVKVCHWRGLFDS